MGHKTRSLENHEIQAVFDGISGRHANRNRTLLLCGIHLALRATELCELEVGDVADGGKVKTYVTIRGETAKFGKERTIRIGDEIKEAIAAFLAWKAERGESLDSSAPLFVSQKGGHVSRITLFNVVKRLMVEAGIDQSPHALRKTGATLYYEQSGYDLIATQEFLGHADPSVTRRYIGITARQRAEYAQRASQALVCAIEGEGLPKRNTIHNLFRFSGEGIPTDSLIVELQRRGFDARSLIDQLQPRQKIMTDSAKVIPIRTARRTHTVGARDVGRAGG